MSKIVWDAIGEHKYETGVDHGVLYVMDNNGVYSNGVAWNGLTSVSESPSGAESNPQYADNIKYLDLFSAEEFGATIECFTYPKEWEECDGSVSPVEGVNIYQQTRKTFGLSYRTKIGNDVTPDLGYKLHLVYNCKATPSERAYNTVNDSPEALSFSYEITTTPIEVEGYKNTSILTIDSTKFVTEDQKARLAALEALLYGTEDTYTEFEGSTFDSSVTYYEKNASGTYVETSDDAPQTGKTYYTKTEGTSATLPLPAKVIETLSGNNG